MDSNSSPKKDRDRKRSYYGAGGSAAKKGKRNRLEPGAKGFLATCSNNDESKCVREVYNLLNDYADRLIGEEKISSNQPVDDKTEIKEENDDDRADKEKNDTDRTEIDTKNADDQSQSKTEAKNDDDDLEAALKKECDELTGRGAEGGESASKGGSKPFQKRFSSLDTGVNNNIFVVSTLADLDPCAAVHSILKDIKETGKCQCRFIQRLLPIDLTCKAYVDDIERTLIANNDLLSKHFSPTDDKDAEPPTYAVFYKARNNSHMKKEDVYQVVGELIQSINPMAKVDLDKPKKAILIDILQTVACIGIVEDYVEFCKYNLHMVSGKSDK